MRTLVKAIGAALRRRALAEVERKSHPSQYACRGGRSSGTLLAELFDYGGGAMLERRLCHVAPFDILSALDHSSDAQAVKALSAIEVSGHARRAIRF